MLHLQEFIENHDNWEELLNKEPYCINIKRKDNRILFTNGYYNYRKGKHGHLDVKDKPIMALTYTINRLKMNKLQSCVHIKHTGRCGICGRRLTDDASVERGFGISCYNKYIMQK